MNTTKQAGAAASLLLAVTLCVGAGALTACQTPRSAAPAPSPSPSPSAEDPAAPKHRTSAVPPDLAGLPADGVERELERRAAAAAQLSERFAGVPADRVEERLAQDATR